MHKENIHTNKINKYNKSYPAAPTTDNATDKAIPIKAHIYGEASSRNLQETKQILLILIFYWYRYHENQRTN